MTENIASTGLLKVLRVRQTRAELSLSQQQQRVAESRERHLESVLAVQELNNNIIDNTRYRVSVQSDARKTNDALSHRKHLEYELERETYYEGVAREELEDELLLLQQKRKDLEKLRIKQENVINLIRKNRVRVDFLQQDVEEEDFQMLQKTGMEK